ncbi:MarR family winged helix-turn-helix transcriptional regulator [Seleniivibrio woodruffii]|uniref:MarR family winged helix-turn-helix transcriptional regulator n=1 Tax=Seleniivibrio woodruffii TaxID=1078050 RepID=UPI0026F165B0|nr:MarR family transcriptional regulator [Seleniivibrio woodruffii]
MKYTDLILAVFRLNGQLILEGDRLAKEDGLTSAKWHVMGALIYFGEQNITVSRIASRMGLRRQGVQRIVNELYENGLVIFEDNPYHKKAKQIVPTDEGMKRFNSVMEKQIPWANEHGGGLNADELETTLKVVRMISARLP